MDPDQQNATRAWVERWLRVGPTLNAIERAELRDFRYDEHIDEIDALLDIGVLHGDKGLTSGLVEQQRLFQKLRL